MQTFFLPSPPGSHRAQEFTQSFRNETGHLVEIRNLESSHVLAAGERIEIAWTIEQRPDRDVGRWKLVSLS
jgi:hypothetical protein